MSQQNENNNKNSSNESNASEDLEKQEAEQNKAASEQGEQIDYLDQLKRLKAEFINFKKRIHQQQQEWYEIAVRDILLRILPAIDDFDHYFSHGNEKHEANHQGVYLIYDKLIKTLQEVGLKELDARDQSFNPEIHEAVKVEQVEDIPDGHILDVWQKGYMVKDKLLRPAKVIVAKNKNQTL